MLPSPSTPNYRRASVGTPRGSNSERVAVNTYHNRRHFSGALLPFNNGKTLPSKWEDAERWIFSPVPGDDAARPSSQLQQRKPKSKSGPLASPGITYSSLNSPVMPILEGRNVGHIVAKSPISARAVTTDGLSVGSGTGNEEVGIHPARVVPYMARSISIHGCSELLNQTSLHGSQDKKHADDKNSASNLFCTLSRKDVGTQMSPDGSPHSSPRRLSFSSSSPSLLHTVKLESAQFSKTEVRDVQVDEHVTLTRCSKRDATRFPRKSSENVGNWKKRVAKVQSPAWKLSEAEKIIAKMEREEAKVTAWENLQKTKAEEAIRELEVKLEKKRSSSMDKIMKKLSSAQKKAHEMRNSVSTNQFDQEARTFKVASFPWIRQISFFRGCFACREL
ncbi:hypothetical protein NMG60_11024240 [Bertholletia excelsa]